MAKLETERRAAAARIAFAVEREKLASLLIEEKMALGRRRDPEARAIAVGLTEGASGVRAARSQESLAGA